MAVIGRSGQSTRRIEKDFLTIVRKRLWEDGKTYATGDVLYTTEERAQQLAGYPGLPYSQQVFIPDPPIWWSGNGKEITLMPSLNDPKPKSNGDAVLEIIAEKRGPRFQIRDVGGVIRVSYHCPCGSITTSSGSIERCTGCGRRP